LNRIKFDHKGAAGAFVRLHSHVPIDTAAWNDLIHRKFTVVSRKSLIVR